MKASFIRRVATIVLALAASLAEAQDWPAKPVKVVVAFAAGGPADIVARLVSKELEGALGTNFIVDNRAGAGGMIGTDFVAKAAPDGYTLIMTSSAAQAVGPGLWPSVPYDAVKDYTHVSLVARGAVGFMVNADGPYKTFADVLAAAKAKPDAINFGSGGPGSLGHLTGELTKRVVGFEMQHVPYKGSAPAQADLLAGQIQVVTDNLASHAAMIRAQKMRALAMAAVQRVDTFPDVPTFTELGYKELVAYAWFGLSGPAGLPPRVVDRLAAAMQAVLSRPEVKARIKDLGLEATPDFPPARYAAYVKSEVDKWGGIIKAANIKVQ